MATAAQLGKHVSKQDLVAVLDLIETAQRVASEQQFHGLMHKLLGVLPIERADVCVAELSPGNAVIRNNRRLSLNYPAEWVQVYRSRGYYRVDPVARRLFVDRKPLIWSQLRRREQTPVEQAFYGTAAEFGLKEGFAFGARFDNTSAGSFFSCAGEDLARHRRHRLLLEYLVPYLHQALSRMHLADRRQQLPPLSPRELEVLTWAKYGKTNAEIAMLLGLSPSTVKFHMENAQHKLDVVNRTQAIAVALAQGLINWS